MAEPTAGMDYSFCWGILSIASLLYKGFNVDRLSLRKNILQTRDRIPAAHRKQMSTTIHNLLLPHLSICKAGHIFIYVHFRSEVQTMDLIKQLLQKGCTVSVPLTLAKQSTLLPISIDNPEEQLIPGYYGIPEPTPAAVAASTGRCADIDTVIVPGSVFDARGGRLGYGGGFYDRFLSRDAPQAKRVALAYEAQMIASVPVEPHDQCMDHVITEKQIYNCQRSCHA
ncbi:MAG: 5-formyltetrahydrofolate cyclo-ligase [Desulfobulbus sp.]|nr:MAG: 5-formyltetrahydrofolate cyclo-ligase [Desulfobulbus sp.]